MGDITELSSSGERLSFFRLFSDKKFKVEIPIIQRDYAQGRPSESEVRDVFLDALYAYLEQGKPNRDLDFVYGSILVEGDSSRFVPLDGQQRLTTLFLLHWYLAQISREMELLRSVLCKNHKSQFSYETRSSSSEFCDSLMACNLDMKNLLKADPDKNNRLSKTILDKGWFYLSWTHDPTIQSMLTMLDSIHAKFSKNPDFFLRLIDEEQPVITFLFLNLDAFSLTDDLYIKMNARGKPLTPFENFKAKFEQQIKSMRTDLPNYKLGFSDKSVDGYEYFIHKVDTDWADIFWGYRNESTEDDTFDDELMNFISLVIANYYLLEERTKSDKQIANIDKFFGTGGSVERLSFQNYKGLGCLSQGLVKHLISMMDLLYSKGLDNGKLKPYLGSNCYYSEDEIFKKVIKNNTSYQEKLRFYAFYNCLAKGLTDAGLMEWMRVVYNLTENTIFNTTEDYRDALISISKLSNGYESILDVLKSDCNVAKFNGAQVLEEKIKAHLISKSSDWEVLVVNAENHPFFRGQIGFALSFSGILDFYRENRCCEWEESQNKTYFDTFKKYVESGSKLFSLIKDSSSVIDYLWEKAVLSKGMYFTKTSAHRWNILSTRLGKNNIERDHSWRRLLRISVLPDSEWEKRQSYVSAVFDDSNFDANSIKDSLKIICDNAIENPAIEDWRRAFIEHSVLFTECRQGFIVKNANEIILLHESQRNHYHSELYSRVIDLEMKNKSDQLLPFKLLPFEPVRNRDDFSYASLGQWGYKDNEYNVEIWFESDVYKLFFYGGGPPECVHELICILEESKFNVSDEGYCSHEDYGTQYIASFKTKDEVFEKLNDLCTGLRGLVGK